MILETVIKEAIESQKIQLSASGSGFPREVKPSLKSISTHALIISGIRRCGKSTLVHQLMETMNVEDVMYVNFETPRLYGFAMNDFLRLDNIINEQKATVLFFDEIQVVEGWEIYVRQKLDEKYKVVITGSNARLLSIELGTKLTGRHITHELFPFSYSEFLSMNNLNPSNETLSEYFTFGGFPDYLLNKDEAKLITLFDDILVKDIIVRHGIKDSISIKRLAVFLFNTDLKVNFWTLEQLLNFAA